MKIIRNLVIGRFQLHAGPFLEDRITQHSFDFLFIYPDHQFDHYLKYDDQCQRWR